MVIALRLRLEVIAYPVRPAVADFDAVRWAARWAAAAHASGLTLREGLLEPVVLKRASGGGRWGDLDEAAGGVEGAGLDEVGAGVEEQAGDALGARPRLGGGEEGAGAACATELRSDIDAGELTRLVPAEAAGRYSVGAQEEKEREADAREPSIVSSISCSLVARWK